MNIKKIFKKLSKKKPGRDSGGIINLYKTDYQKHVLISYITAPFISENHFTHQNYLTSHIVAESFSELGYNVDVVDYFDASGIDYDKYAVIFGFGLGLEHSFYTSNRKTPRIYFVTGAHHYLHNAMSLRSIKDFYALSGLWLAKEGHVLTDCSYYSMFNSDFAIILAQGYILEDYKSRFANTVYSLNNNIINVFSDLKSSDSAFRKKNFLFLSGARQITKGLPLLLEIAKIRKDLNFHVVVPSINAALENYYKDVFEGTNVFLHRNIRMDSDEMKDIIKNCSYSIAPSYIDGLPGGTIEPMSAGLIPIVSRYCGFPEEEFIFEMEELSVPCLNHIIDKVLGMNDDTYIKYSNAVKAYACENFSADYVKKELIRILKLESL